MADWNRSNHFDTPCTIYIPWLEPFLLLGDRLARSSIQQSRFHNFYLLPDGSVRARFWNIVF
jgi:hypothetical protein